MRNPPPFWCLERLELFRAIGRHRLEAVARRVRPVRLNRRQLMTVDDAGCVFVVGIGAVKLCRTSWLGRRLVEAVLQPGDVFGRISTGSGPTCSVESLDRTTLLQLDRDVFVTLIQSEPQFSYQVVQMLEDRQRRLERQVDSLVFRDVPTRVVEAILYLAREHGDRCTHGWAVDVRVTQQDLADLVGASRQAVSSVLRKLELGFYLRRKGRVICIISLKRLQRLVSEPGEHVQNPAQL